MSELVPARRALILGIGNVLWADEGFGVRCVEAFHERYALPDDVQLLDGGTQGLYLVPYVTRAERLLVFDVVDFGLPPGTLKLLEGDEVPSYGRANKVSMHQTGLQDVLAAATLLGHAPKDVALIGAQAGQLEDFGGGLSPPVAAALDAAVALSLVRLAAWGVVAQPRSTAAETLLGPGLSRRDYEDSRPTEAQACRVGDPRVLARAAPRN